MREIKFKGKNQYTGFKDKNGEEIYENDRIGEWSKVDGIFIRSNNQVFWCEKTGAWMLDFSFKQDKSFGELLSDELNDYEYEIITN